MKRTPQKKNNTLEDNFSLGSYTFIHNQNLLIDLEKNEHRLTTKENELLKLFCLILIKRLIEILL